MPIDFQTFKIIAINNLLNCQRDYIKYYSGAKKIKFDEHAIQKYIKSAYYRNQLTIISRNISTIAAAESEYDFLQAIKTLLDFIENISGDYFWNWMFTPSNYWLRIYFLQCFKCIHPLFTAEFNPQRDALFLGIEDKCKSTPGAIQIKAMMSRLLVHEPSLRQDTKKVLPRKAEQFQGISSATIVELNGDDEVSFVLAAGQAANGDGGIRFFSNDDLIPLDVTPAKVRSVKPPHQ